MEMPPPEQDQSNKEKTTTRAFFTEWLEKLQQESWQLELLISGLALYLVWETRKKLDALDLFVQLNQGSDIFGDSMGVLMIFAWGTWAIFMLNLLVHILVRGLWIGAIGLRYVSGEIDYKALHYSSVFEKYLERKVGRFDGFIEKLEKVCSLIFAYTFLLFFLFLSMLMYFGLLAAVIYLSNDWVNANIVNGRSFVVIVLIFIYLVLGFIYFIDFITVGGVKRIKEKSISKIYLIIYLFFSIITLSFLYRPLVYNFIDHYYSRRLLWFSIPYFTIVFLIAPSINYNADAYFPIRFKHEAGQESLYAVDPLTIKWAFYEDQRQQFLSNNPDLKAEGRIIDLATIRSYEISSDYTMLFLRLKSQDNTYLEKVENLQPQFLTGLKHEIQSIYPEDPKMEHILDSFEQQKIAFLKYKNANSDLFVKEVWTDKLDSLNQLGESAIFKYTTDLMHRRLEACKNIFEVTIDSMNYSDSLSCKFYFHPNLGEKGLLCRLPLTQIQEGEHLIAIERKRYRKFNNKTHQDSILSTTFYIPFYKYSE